MISTESRKIIKDAQIRIFDYSQMIVLVKKTGAYGNAIPNQKFGPILLMDTEANIIEEVYSDCPHLSVSLINSLYKVSVWSWVPGPGPGDFELSFDNEIDAIKCSLNYFLTKNEYFEERRKHHKNQ